MDFELTRENGMVQDAVRNWVNKECTRDVVSELDEKGEFPKKLLKKLSKLGFCGMIIPEDYEGEGKNVLGACLVVEEIATIYPALASCYISPTFHGGAVISELANDDQKKRWLPVLSQGKSIVSLAVSEDFDTDVEKVKTIAESNEKGFIVSGSKSAVILANQADLMILLARTSAENEDLTVFCINPKSAGISIRPTEKMGYQGASLCTVNLDTIQVSRDDILGGPEQIHQGRKQLDQIQNIALLAVAASAVGMAQGALDYSLQHAKQRVQFGTAIGRFPAINRRFAETAYKVEAARLLVYKAAWTADQGKSYSRSVAMAKCFAAETAVKSAMEGLQVLGGYGYTMEYDIQRYVRDSVALLSAGLSSDYLKEKIGISMGLG